MSGKFIQILSDGTSRSIEIDFSFNGYNEKKARKKVALCIRNKLDFIDSYFSVLRQGNIPIVLNANLTQKKCIEVATKLEAHFLWIGQDKISLKYDDDFISTLGHILCTSGTTSLENRPKSYFFSLRKPVENSIAHQESLSDLTAKRVLFPLSLYHSFGVVVGLWSTVVKNLETFFYENEFTPKQIFDTLRKEQIEILYLTPSLARQLIKFSKRYKKKIVAPRIVSVGSSLFKSHEMASLQKIFTNSRLFYTYGLTEMGPRVSTYLYQDSHQEELLPLGIFLAKTEYKINKTLYIKSEYCADEFENTFFNTHDFVLNYNNDLYIQGRDDDVIISQGINIFAHEVEALVRGYDDVEDCALVAENSTLFGQIPVLFIQGKIQKELLIRFLEEDLPLTHLPKKVLYIASLPKTELGKIKKKVLIQLASENIGG
ncbi:MAG: class I adenylate-forming enzyme family protein [Bacteriovoracaceae bacterium]|jgi:O-succinylbenzoic acid--CoA ligase|nr:class I adenylate-forming enzyme family protein [Bacteriovoracaceae bacterium]